MEREIIFEEIKPKNILALRKDLNPQIQAQKEKPKAR